MPQTERFGLQRKIVAAMTSAGWRQTPHACFIYEAEVTGLMEVLKELNAGRDFSDAITINTAMLKIIVEGIKACPKMNGHIRYNAFLAGGSVTTFEQIDVTLPVILDRNTMMTLNIHGMEQKSISGIRDAVADAVRRAKNSNLQQVMFEVAMHDTLLELRRGRVFRALGRLLGVWLEGGQKQLLHGRAKREYQAIPETERLTRQDLEQGTVTVTNPGMLYKRWDGECVMLEIVPPQIAAVGINMVRDRAVVDTDGTIRAGKIMALTIAFDHRALDGADLVPFVARVDRILRAPEMLRDWI